MLLRDLKEKIESKKLSDDLIIIESLDNNFVADQYINEISNFKKLEIFYCDSIPEFPLPGYLYIYKCESAGDIIPIDNLIVICNKYTGNTLNDYVVTIPKLENWQIENYVINRLPGLTRDKCVWLCKSCNYDIYRLNLEVDKISIFDEKYHENIFRQINDDNGYSDLSSFTQYDIINAILKKDINKIIEYLSTDNNISQMTILYSLINSLKNIIDVQFNPNENPEKLHLSSKQFYAIKKNSINYYKNESLIRMMKFLTEVDFKVKKGLLNSEIVLKYILVNLYREEK